MYQIERLELNPDTTLKTKLERKRDEYATRLAGQIAARGRLDTFYKLRLLTELLEKGVVDVAEFAARDDIKGDSNLYEFTEALKVIAAYNANDDTAYLRGGTGLK